MTLSEDAVIDVSRGIDELVKRCQADGKGHDLTIGLGKGGSGLTIHCNNDTVDVAASALRRHGLGRKYTEQAKTWFGICVSPTDVSLRFGRMLDFPWERSEELDSLTKGMKESGSFSALFPPKPKNTNKPRSNDPCPCGSGKKYKRCCL